MAVNGDQTALAAIADPDRVEWLLYPDCYYSRRRQWVIAPGPVLTDLAITRLETDAAPPELTVKWQFTGRRRWADADPGASGPESGEQPGDESFIGLLSLAFSESEAWPWRLESGSHVQTLDDYLGYTFASGTETADECRQRTGAREPLAPTDTYLLVADFAEHDEKFGSTATATATVEVSSYPAPTRDEAARLVGPAMQAECVRWRGGVEGDWHPSLSHLRVIRLLGPV
jgi:hypothetical protein